MNALMPPLALSIGLALAACSAPQPNAGNSADDGAATSTTTRREPPVASAPATANRTEPAPQTTDVGRMPSIQAGWYSDGTFRACGSTSVLKVDDTADIERRITAGGMTAGEPVYVQLEGMPMSGNAFMLTRVVQVGSKTPVPDCAMTGTTIQSGG